MSEQSPAGPRSETGVRTTDSASAHPAELHGSANMPATMHAGYRRGFFFWSLAPFLVLFLVVMAIIPDKDSPGKIVILCALEAAALSLLVGLWNPYRFWWAWRVLGMIVFLAFAAYVGAMAIEGRIGLGRRSEPSLINAVLGLVALGLPGLWYAIFGRLTWSRESTHFGDDHFDEDLIDGPPPSGADDEGP